jgi:hypothetical protein
MNVESSTFLEKHPINVVEAIVARYGTRVVFTFSRYEVGPPGDQERRPRTTFEIGARHATKLWLEKQLSDLGPDEELALHSRVSCEKRWCHLLMIDYERNCSLSEVRNLGLRVLSEIQFAGLTDPQNPSRIYSFETGRCYHQYADLLIPENAWYHHLGSLLLLTPPCEAPLIDLRWIGHALRRGHAALRWSHNTRRYLLMPRLVDEIMVETSQRCLG